MGLSSGGFSILRPAVGALSRYQHPWDTWFLEGRCLLALKREVAGACGGAGVSCRGVHGMEGQVQWDGFERQLLRRPRLEGRAVEWKVLEEGDAAAAGLWCGCSQKADRDGHLLFSGQEI